MNIRELDEESRRTGVWPPRRIILRVERDSAEAEQPVDAPPPVSVGLVDLASPSRPKVRPSPRSRHARPSVAPEALAAGQVAPRPPLSRPPAPGSVVRRNGRIIAAPRPASRDRDEDAEFAKWLAMPLAISDADPEYQEPPAWLPEDRRLRAERRHRRITRRTRSQILGTSVVTTLAAAGCCIALAGVLSQTETVGGSLGVPSIGLFGTRPVAPAEPAATVRQPAASTGARKASKRPERAARRKPAASSPARPRQAASAPATDAAPARTQSSAPTPQRAVTPPPPPPPPAATPAPKPKAKTPAKQASPKPVPAPPANSSPSGSGSPALGDAEPSL